MDLATVIGIAAFALIVKVKGWDWMRDNDIPVMSIGIGIVVVVWLMAGDFPSSNTEDWR